MNRLGIALVISAPSGTGKTTLIKRLRKEFPNFGYSISCTTRAPREGEVDGKDYHFLSRERFVELRDQGHFAEWAEVHGNFYGTPKKYVDEAMEQGKDVILDIEVQGAAQVCAKRPETVRIFIAPPSWEELERRLTARGTDTPEKVQKRLLRAQVELQNASDYDYFVINDTVEQAVEELRAILCAEHCKPAERMELILNGKEM